MNANRFTFFTEKIKQLKHKLKQTKTMQQNIEIVKESVRCYHVLSQYLLNNDNNSDKKEVIELCKVFQEIENEAVIRCQRSLVICVGKSLL